MPNNDIIVFSHLRWEFVTQRPQHILNRLAKKRKVVFVEEPIESLQSDKTTANIYCPSANIMVVQPSARAGDSIAHLLPILINLLVEHKIKKPLLWFYSPAFVDVAEVIDYSFVIYDCMDELSAFMNAPKELRLQEQKLFELADIVFTGGKSLYEAKKNFHDRVFCFPSAVDQTHFEKAMVEDTVVPAELLPIPAPVVLFYGVIDERLDTTLLAKISEEMPQVSFVLVGPVVKIAPSSLPVSNNLFYLGSRPYDALPGFLKGSDITMMPFALNESTRFISPTKTLEYFAAGKPVISTPIKDVVADYQYIVRICDDAPSFCAAIEYFLKEPLGAKIQRQKIQDDIVKNITWDNTVEKMESLINQLHEQKQEQPAAVTI